LVAVEEINLYAGWTIAFFSLSLADISLSLADIMATAELPPTR